MQRRDVVLEVEVFADFLHDRIMDRALDVDLLRFVGVLVGSVPSVFDAVLDGLTEDSVCFRFHVFIGLVWVRLLVITGGRIRSLQNQIGHGCFHRLLSFPEIAVRSLA